MNIKLMKQEHSTGEVVDIILKGKRKANKGEGSPHPKKKTKKWKAYRIRGDSDVVEVVEM